MAISVDWANKLISVPQSYCTPIVGTLYELDTDQLRLDLKALEAAEVGMPFQDTHRHNTTVTVAGVTYARTIEVINGYAIQFTPDAQWTVRLAGSNNNLFDVENNVLVQNQVQVISTNSAGLQVVTSGSGVLPSDVTAIAAATKDAVWDEPASGHTSPGTLGEAVGEIPALPTAAETAAAVWDEPVPASPTADSFAERFKKLLTVSKFLGLK